MADLVLRAYYNGQWNDLDIDSNIPLRLDVSAVENTSIGSIYGVGSQTFNLPGTRNNNAFFKGAYKVGAQAIPAFADTIDATILYNGETLLNGALQLQEIITDQSGYIEYVVTVQDDTVDFINQIQNKLIYTASYWNQYTHSLSPEIISSSWEGDLFSGSIFYPVVDYGTDQPDYYPSIPRLQVGGNIGDMDSSQSPLQLKQFLPAVKVTTLVDAIFDQAGFNYTSSLLSSSAFDKMYVLPKGSNTLGAVASGSSSGLVTAGISGSLSDDYFTIGAISQSNQAFDIETIIYNNVTANNEGLEYDTATGRYYVSVDGIYEFEASVTTTNPSNFFNGAEYLFGAYRTIPGVSGGYLGPTSASYQAGSGFDPDVGIWVNIENTVTEYLYSGSYVDFRLALGPLSGSSFNPSYPIRATGSFFFNQASSMVQGIENIDYGSAEINMGEQFGTQAKSVDLLTGLLTQFNAVAVPEPNSAKTIRIENFETFMNQGRDVDWTYRYDTAKRMAIKHPVSEQPRQFIIKNADDEDRFSKLSIDNDPNFQYGTIRVISDRTVSEGEKEIETYYAPTVVAPIIQSGSLDSDGNPTFNLSLGNLIVPHLYKFNNNAQETYQFKPRLGYKIDGLYAAGAQGGIKIQTGSANFSSYSTLANLSALPAYTSSFGFDVTVNDLHFDNQYFDLIPGYFQANNGTTAYETYWEKYINDLYAVEGRKVTLDLQFSPVEYQDIRLNDKIFIYGEEYRINKIKGFNLQMKDVVTVELIKLATTAEKITDCTLLVSASYGVIEVTPTPTPTVTLPPTPTPTFVGPTPTPTVTPADCDFNLVIGNAGCTFELQIGAGSATPTPTATATPLPTPTPTPSLGNVSNGFAITSGDTIVGGVTYNGFHQGTLLGCPSVIAHGSTRANTTTQIALPGLDCYDVGGSFLSTKGYGVQGAGSQSTYALTQFTTNDSDGPGTGIMSIINSNTVSFPSLTSISGTVSGSNGTNSTFTATTLAVVPVYATDDGNGPTVQPERTYTVSFNNAFFELEDNVDYNIEI